MTSGLPDYTTGISGIITAIENQLKTADYVDHYNDNVGVVAATIDLTATNVALLIENTHAAQNLLVSFDEGTTFKIIEPGDMLSVDTSVSSFDIKGSGAATTYEILAGRV